MGQAVFGAGHSFKVCKPWASSCWIYTEWRDLRAYKPRSVVNPTRNYTISTMIYSLGYWKPFPPKRTLHNWVCHFSSSSEIVWMLFPSSSFYSSLGFQHGAINVSKGYHMRWWYFWSTKAVFLGHAQWLEGGNPVGGAETGHWDGVNGGTPGWGHQKYHQNGDTGVFLSRFVYINPLFIGLIPSIFYIFHSYSISSSVKSQVVLVEPPFLHHNWW